MARSVLLALGALLLMDGFFGAGLVVSPLLTPSPARTPAQSWDQMALRVDDFRGCHILTTRLQEGWQVERQDSDGRGTTYFLQRDRRLGPTPGATPSLDVAVELALRRLSRLNDILVTMDRRQAVCVTRIRQPGIWT